MASQITKSFIEERIDRIQTLYLEDQIPWVVGYSGGKDSSATLEIVWYALSSLPKEKLHKTVHVISTDTLVEQPIVCAWVNKSLELMKDAAQEQGLPIEPHRLTPKIEDSFWVNLIGKGYPAPRQSFRWCTSRLKINPSNKFIQDIVKTHGETIMVLGTRKAESAARAATMNKYEKSRIRQWLSPNASLPNSWVFSPLEDWSNDDVWTYLMQYPNPWGRLNKDLLAMYRGASADNECPLVVDTTTPSCGNSRFGCWVCTLVSSDKSMAAMIQNDEEKVWLTPLLEFRNEIAELNEEGRIADRYRRDFRRMDGRIKINAQQDGTIHGPYLKTWREYFLKRLLEVQKEIHATAPPEVRKHPIITMDELREIRRIWVIDKHAFDDKLPDIYLETMGEPFPFIDDIEPGPFSQNEWVILESLSENSTVYLELLSSLLDIEQSQQGAIRRRGVIDQIDLAIKRCFYENEEDALAFAKSKQHDMELELDLSQEEGLEVE